MFLQIFYLNNFFLILGGFSIQSTDDDNFYMTVRLFYFRCRFSGYYLVHYLREEHKNATRIELSIPPRIVFTFIVTISLALNPIVFQRWYTRGERCMNDFCRCGIR